MDQTDDLDALDLSSPIECPGCGARMQRSSIDGVEIDRCASCGGLWLDALEKEKLLESRTGVRKADAPRPAHAPPSRRHIQCPRDHSRMIHLVDPVRTDVGFESCTVCGGVFLDAGELTDLSRRTLMDRFRTLFG
jgi:Zn-finger nucleic acid-binding protein